MENNFATQSGLLQQTKDTLKNSHAMGQAFDEAKDDSSFYPPPEVFDNPEFKRGLSMFFSPATRSGSSSPTKATGPRPKAFRILTVLRVGATGAQGHPLAGSNICTWPAPRRRSGHSVRRQSMTDHRRKSSGWG